MGHDYQYDDHEAEFQAAWEAEEVEWERRVEERMEALEWRAMFLALVGRLDAAKTEMRVAVERMHVAEAALCVAIDRAEKGREMCSAIADTIEAVSRMVRG